MPTTTPRIPSTSSPPPARPLGSAREMRAYSRGRGTCPRARQRTLRKSCSNPLPRRYIPSASRTLSSPTNAPFGHPSACPKPILRPPSPRAPSSRPSSPCPRFPASIQSPRPVSLPSPPRFLRSPSRPPSRLRRSPSKSPILRRRRPRSRLASWETSLLTSAPGLPAPTRAAAAMQTQKPSSAPPPSPAGSPSPPCNRVPSHQPCSSLTSLPSRTKKRGRSLKRSSRTICRLMLAITANRNGWRITQPSTYGVAGQRGSSHDSLLRSRFFLPALSPPHRRLPGFPPSPSSLYSSSHVTFSSATHARVAFKLTYGTDLSHFHLSHPSLKNLISLDSTLIACILPSHTHIWTGFNSHSLLARFLHISHRLLSFIRLALFLPDSITFHLLDRAIFSLLFLFT